MFVRLLKSAKGYRKGSVYYVCDSCSSNQKFFLWELGTEDHPSDIAFEKGDFEEVPTEILRLGSRSVEICEAGVSCGCQKYSKKQVGTGDKRHLLLDFNPFVRKALKMNMNFLIHWQARPKGKRRWGVYDIERETYYCSNSVDIIGDCQGIQIDETKVLTLPTSMIIADEIFLPKKSKPQGARYISV